MERFNGENGQTVSVQHRSALSQPVGCRWRAWTPHLPLFFTPSLGLQEVQEENGQIPDFIL